MARNISCFMIDCFPLPGVAELALTGRIDEVKELWCSHMSKYGPKAAAIKRLVLVELNKPMPEKLHDVALMAGYVLTDCYMIGRFCQVIKTMRRGQPWVYRANLSHPEAAKDVCEAVCNNMTVFLEEETSIARGFSFTYEGKTVTKGNTGRAYRKLTTHEALKEAGYNVGKNGCPIAQSIKKGGASAEPSAKLAKCASSYESKWADTIWAKRRGFNGKPFKELYKIAADNGLLIQIQNSLIMPVGESFRRLVINFNDQIRCPVVLQQQGASRFRINTKSLFKVAASELKKISIQGGHIDPGGLYRRLRLLDYEVEHIDLATGMTRARVKTTNGVIQTKLMFPTSWSGEVVLDQIAQGCCNIDKTIACGDGSFNIECSTNAGLRMRMHVDKSGTIKTCIPLESAATYWATPEEAKTLCKLRLSEPSCTIVPAEEIEIYRKYTDLASKATPEEAAALCSGIKHNFNGNLTTDIEEIVRKTFYKKLSTDTRSCLNLDSRNGGIGSIARLNDVLYQDRANCRIVPAKQFVKFHDYFVSSGYKIIMKKVRVFHSPAGKAGAYEGLEVVVDLPHVFNSKCKGKTISGGHWDPNGCLRRAGILKFETIIPGLQGCYEGKGVTLLNRSHYPRKSYFGDNWTAEQITQAFCEALDNIIEIKPKSDGGLQIFGLTKTNLEIEMIAEFVNDKVYVNSFFPKINS
ncbi:hypothetical protein HOF26_02885 [bacterium]|nr:hypothetical protein [bacterium]